MTVFKVAVLPDGQRIVNGCNDFVLFVHLILRYIFISNLHLMHNDYYYIYYVKCDVFYFKGMVDIIFADIAQPDQARQRTF